MTSHRGRRAAVTATVAALTLAGCAGGAADRSRQTATPPTTDLRAAGAKPILIRGTALAAGAGAVWLTGLYAVYRLDPRTGRTIAKVPVPQDPCERSVFAFGALWTATRNPPGLARIDPASNRLTHHRKLRIPLDTTLGQASLGAGKGAVWVVLDGPGCSACRLAKVDPDSLHVRARIPVASGSAGVVAAYGAVWVSNPA
jgi:streptogramin lyase